MPTIRSGYWHSNGPRQVPEVPQPRYAASVVLKLKFGSTQHRVGLVVEANEAQRKPTP